jgi:hypothetical protein
MFDVLGVAFTGVGCVGTNAPPFEEEVRACDPSFLESAYLFDPLFPIVDCGCHVDFVTFRL